MFQGSRKVNFFQESAEIESLREVRQRTLQKMTARYKFLHRDLCCLSVQIMSLSDRWTLASLLNWAEGFFSLCFFFSYLSRKNLLPVIIIYLRYNSRLHLRITFSKRKNLPPNPFKKAFIIYTFSLLITQRQLIIDIFC